MKDENKTKQQLIEELEVLQRRAVKLEKSEDERKQVEEELELRARLLDNATDSIFVHDFEGNFIYLNEVGYRSRGYSKDELMGMNLKALDVPEHAKLIKLRIMELMKKGKIIFESAHFRKDKSIMPVEIHARIIESGGRKLILSVVRDITEHKQAEEELKRYQYRLEELVEKRTNDLVKANELLQQEISERKQAEETIRESEDRYHVLFNSGNDAVFAHHPTPDNLPGIFIEVNDVACQMLGYTREELLKLSPMDIVVLNKVKGAASATMKKLLVEKRTLTESIFVAKDGREIPVEVSPHLFDFHGRPTILTIVRDMTQRKRKEEELEQYRYHLEQMVTERTTQLTKANKQLKQEISERRQAGEALRESEERFRTSIENMLNGFAYCKILVDENNQPIDFVYLTVNDAFEKLTGLRKEDIVGKKATEAIPGIKDANPELFSIYGEVALTGKPTNFEIFFEPLQIWLTISVYSPKKGYFVAVFENITERKQAEETIRDLAKFPSENPNPVLRVAKNGTILYANQASLPLLNVWGCEIGKSLPDHLHQTISGVLRAGSPEYVEIECGKQTFSFIFAPIVEAKYVNLYGRDITERKQAKETIQAMVESTARITGRDYFSNMIRALCEWLRCDVGIVGKFIDNSTVEALTMQVDGKIIKEYRYALSGTPCDNVRKKGFCHYPENVTSLFPDDKELAELDLSGYVGIPLRDSRGKPLGILCAMSHKPMELPERAEEVMGVFAARAAGEIERKNVEAELRKDKRRIRELATAYVHAQEEERQWIALEVHDRILQTLTAIFHQLQMLESITQATPEARDLAVHAFTLMQGAIHETRNIMKDLYPQALEKFGLAPLMNEELHRFEEETGARVRLLTDCPVRAPRDIETTFYRIFHEALLNVKKHATGVKKVTVSLTYKKEISTLQVKDDGNGFDAVAAMQGKVTAGLESMRRRAEIVGGTFEVKSISGKGTTVTVHIPLLLKTGGNKANNSPASNTAR